MHTMTRRQGKSGTIDVKALLSEDEEFLRTLVRTALQEVLEAEMTEELCGHSFSASSISAMNQGLDASLAQFAGRPLAEAFPYLILDARYERVREAGVITSQAVLIAIGIDWDGRRQSLPQRKPGCWRSSSPTARAGRAGAISCSG